MEETERQTIINYLAIMNGNKSETAKVLGRSRTTLYEKMNKYGLYRILKGSVLNDIAFLCVIMIRITLICRKKYKCTEIRT